jgi:hypothetical protein
MCNVDEKILEVIRKKGVIKQVENQTPIELSMHKISFEHNDNQKTNLRWCSKRNVHAYFLKCSCKDDPLFSLKWSIVFSNNYSNGKMQAWTVEGTRSWAHTLQEKFQFAIVICN